MSYGDEHRTETHYQRKDVADSYDTKRFLNLGGRLVDWLEKRALRRALSDVHKEHGVLEIACGTGRMTEVLTRQGFRTIGLDISPAMMSWARQRLDGDSNLKGFVRGDAKRLPIRSESVGAVVAFRFVPHLPAEARACAYREIRRVAQARAIISFESSRSLRSFMRRSRLRRHRTPSGDVLSPAEFAEEAGREGLALRRRFSILPLIALTNVAVLDVLSAK